MWSKVLSGKATLAFFAFLPKPLSHDKLSQATKTEQLAAESETSNEETGIDRVKRMFETDEYGNVTVELYTVLQTGFVSMFTGLVIGGTMYGRKAYDTFIRNNEATSFETAFIAKQKLQEAVVLGFCKGGFRWAWRLSLFCTSFLGVVTTMQVYRNHYGVSEYVVAGALSGFLYKFNMGPRAWIVGAGLGATLGIFTGGLTSGLLHLSGMNMEQARYWQYKWNEARTEHFRKSLKEYTESEELPALKIHNDKVGEIGKSLDNLDKIDTSNKG